MENEGEGGHVVIFPLPLQGPVNCMLNLAELILCETQRRVSVTFITTKGVATRLSLHSDVKGRFSRFGSRFMFESVDDGLGPDQNNLRGAGQLGDVTDSLAAQALDPGTHLRKLLTYGGTGTPSVTCLIADGFFWFMVDVCKQLRLPLLYFETVSPAGLWTYLHLPHLLQHAYLPFSGDDDLDAPITSVPGMEAYLRRRDLPFFCRSYAPDNQVIQLILKQAKYFPQAQGHILNTFDELEAPLLSHLRHVCPNLYTIGPIHSLIPSRIDASSSSSSSSSSSRSRSSLWEEDRSCLAWLDAQPSKSVLFVSIGSLAVMTRSQVMEFWHGLVNSKVRFLWVRRPGSVIDMGKDEGHDREVPVEVERGRIVSWVPQEEVLRHQAIGGFLTHSGWNSTLESIAAGVPMICWPYFVEQQVNSRVVSQVWGIGLDIKDTCDRVIIEKAIKELMAHQPDQFAIKMDKLSKLASQAVAQAGTSYCNLDRLIDDIQFSRLTTST